MNFRRLTPPGLRGQRASAQALKKHNRSLERSILGTLRAVEVMKAAAWDGDSMPRGPAPEPSTRPAPSCSGAPMHLEGQRTATGCRDSTPCRRQELLSSAF